MENKEVKVKVCLVGGGGVGKTSLIRRYVNDMFDDKYIATIGTKVTKKEITIKDQTGSEIKMDMMIWDIMGQKGFKQLLQDAYFYGTKGVIAVSDITRKDTLEDLTEWLESVNEVAGEVPAVFLANKCDLEDQAQFNMKDLEKTASEHTTLYPYLTSAKTGQNVQSVFQTLAEKIVEQI